MPLFIEHIVASLTLNTLKNLCSKTDLKTSGAKSTLAQRLSETHVGNVNTVLTLLNKSELQKICLNSTWEEEGEQYYLDNKGSKATLVERIMEFGTDEFKYQTNNLTKNKPATTANNSQKAGPKKKHNKSKQNSATKDSQSIGSQSMTQSEEQQFLNNLEKKLWNAADKLRSTLDAANYKHTVLGLIFLKYVSDAFDIRREELKAQLQNPEHDYFLDPEDFGGEGSNEYEEELHAELEARDYYLETNTFWVPAEGRWQFLQDNNKTVIGGAKIPLADGTRKKITSVGHLIDNALEMIEAENSKLKGVLNKLYTRLQIDQAKLGELIDLIATIPFKHDSLNSKDILGHVYEYMLGQFALAEGKKGGQFYTPKSIVSLIVQILEPYIADFI